MRVEPQQRNAHPTEDRGGSMNLPTFAEKLTLRGSRGACGRLRVRLGRISRRKPREFGWPVELGIEAVNI